MLRLYSDGTGTFIRDSQGQLVADQIPGSTYYYLLDGLGSAVGLTNGTGTQVASYQYNPYSSAKLAEEDVILLWKFC